MAVEESTRSRVTNIFKHGAALGMTVCRSWAFNDAAYDALQETVGVYSEQAFKALDFVVMEAGRYGVRLLLTLVNNLPDYGGKTCYVQWARDAGIVLDGDTDDHFFSHPILRNYYKAHVKTVLTRVNSFTNVEYRNDPTIFGWELINEPRCAQESSSGAFQAWIEEMAAYVKSLDSKHLLTIGLEGFYKKSGKGTSTVNPHYMPGSGTDFIENHEVDGIDFATVHAYPDLWMPWEDHSEKQKFFDAWVDAHIKDADEILQMPVLFSEFGLLNSQERLAMYTSMYDRIYESAKYRGAGGGALAWQLLDEEMANVWDDGFAIFPGQDLPMIHLIKLQSCRSKLLPSSSDECLDGDQSSSL
uniref:mannan endo-1,4-beta-mannosidase n=1 Tax=Physcomitrium patens TaxID=3218 RepID=A0A7I4DSS8_PHYPA